MTPHTPSVLPELSSTEYPFLQELVVTPQAPLQPEVIPQPPLSQGELIELRGARTELDRMRIAMEEQGKMLVSVTSRMHNAEEEVKSLKRTASREEPTPEAKQIIQTQLERRAHGRHAGH